MGNVIPDANFHAGQKVKTGASRNAFSAVSPLAPLHRLVQS